MKPFLIVQTSATALNICSQMLLAAGFVPEVDFKLFHDPRDVIPHIKEDTVQTLITGTFSGDNVAAERFVREMKGKNPKLVAGFFSSMEQLPGPPYDFIVEKGLGRDFAASLIVKMREVLGK